MRAILSFSLLILTITARSQKIDSIFFHLYTDSLKKGVHNYINVDGKLPDGKWLPLTSKEIELSCSAAKFDGNDLVLPADFKEEKVTVRAVLKNNPAATKEIIIWIKKKPDDEVLPTKEDIMNGTKPKKKRNRG